MKNPPNAGLFRLIWPPEGSDAPQTKNGIPPPHAAIVEHIPFFWVAARTENAQSSKWFGASYNCTLQQFPPRRHVQKLFIFEIEFRFTFLDHKILKVDLKVPFSNSKNSMIFNDLLVGIICINLKSFFLSSNFWNILKFSIFLKKRIWFPLELQL